MTIDMSENIFSNSLALSIFFLSYRASAEDCVESSYFKEQPRRKLILRKIFVFILLFKFSEISEHLCHRDKLTIAVVLGCYFLPPQLCILLTNTSFFLWFVSACDPEFMPSFPHHRLKRKPAKGDKNEKRWVEVEN